MKASVKYRVIHRFRSTHPIERMCDFFQVSKSGYYAWLKRLDKDDKDKHLAELIGVCQEKSKRTYGYRRVKIWLLREYGLVTNHKAVLRVMNKYDMLSEIRRRTRHRKNGEALHRYDNLLNRDFTAERPNQKWVTDITYIHTTQQGFLYASMIRDLHGGFIVNCETGTEQTVGLVTKTVRNAMQKEKVADGLALHSDQGAQYTSEEYFELSKEYKFRPSMSRKGNCLDNACAESFFSALKAECINRCKPATIAEARRLIADYIHFYNYERIQLKTGLTPYEKRCQPA